MNKKQLSAILIILVAAVGVFVFSHEKFGGNGGNRLGASVIGSFSNNGAPEANIVKNSTNGLVMDVTIPDAWNGGSFTADILQKAGSAEIWQGDALHAIPALGSTSGVGYKEDGTSGFIGTEPVVKDLDGDGVYTSAADTIVIDNSDTPVAGDALHDVVAGDKVCADSSDLELATYVYTDSDGNCDSSDGTIVYYLGSAGGTTDTLIVTGDNWATTDSTIDASTDFIKENVAEELTYSAGADTDVYSTGGLSAGDALTDFPSDCDGADLGTRDCKFTGTSPISSASSILIDEGDAGGSAPNSVVDKEDDHLTGLGVQNTGTAVNGDDISAVKVWAENGSTEGFQSDEDTFLGTMTVNSTNDKEWRLGELPTVIPNGGLELYVAVNPSLTAADNSTLTFQIPVFADAGSDGVASADGDVGIFTSSNNSGPTDDPIVNENTQTITAIPGNGGGQLPGSGSPSGSYGVGGSNDVSGGVSAPASKPTTPATPSTGLSAIQSLKNNLALGSRGNDVKTLQEFLISQAKGVAATALTDAGATGYFGKLTMSAVVEWQKAVGIDPAVGAFGPKSRAMVKSLSL